MSIDIDLGKLLIGACAFIVTLSINRNIKRIDTMNEKLDLLAIDLAQLKGSIAGRFVINNVEKR
jgi:hypothetical protein